MERPCLQLIGRYGIFVEIAERNIVALLIIINMNGFYGFRTVRIQSACSGNEFIQLRILDHERI